MHARRWLRFFPASTAGAVALVLSISGGASSTQSVATTLTPPTFSAPQELPDQTGTGGSLTGGEPSLTIDVVNGITHVYVSSPIGVPAIAGQLTGGATCGNGAAFWRSADGAGSFSPGQCIGSGLGGGDDSTAVTPNHNLYLADLEAVASAVCKSTDLGATFTSGNGIGGCTQLVTDQTGPEDDRPWLTGGPQNQLYFTYHDFAFGLPLIERSDNAGSTFLPCGSILQPGSAAMTNYSPAEGTLVADPAIDRAGNLYVEVSEPSNTNTSQQFPLTHLFMAVGKGGCNKGTVFKDSTIYANSGANLGNIFDAVAVDGGGTIYVVAAGQTTSASKTSDVWLFTSHDGGTTWSAPVQVNAPGLTANAMPAIVGGPVAGQVAVGWYGSSTSNTPDDTNDVWNYYVATSTQGGLPGTFGQAQVTPTPFHFGDICTEGVFCGMPGFPSNRNLLDFTSLGVDPLTGCVVAAMPGDPYNTFAVQAAGKGTGNSSVYVARQTGRCFATS
ncbi:MAG TPA: sialidase family protein [Acidimicrobiales bacterium]|nr:sialidase family protein [Acidimicrobiales bacterium]